MTATIEGTLGLNVYEDIANAKDVSVGIESSSTLNENNLIGGNNYHACKADILGASDADVCESSVLSEGSKVRNVNKDIANQQTRDASNYIECPYENNLIWENTSQWHASEAGKRFELIGDSQEAHKIETVTASVKININ